MRKAIFLDRDGTINVRLIGDYVKKISEFKLLHGVRKTIKKFKEMGYLVIIVSNQQGVGKGLMTENDLKKINNYMLNLIPEIDDVFYCTSLEKENSFYRKPNPGMLWDAIKKWNIDPFNSWMVGDSESDLIAGKAVGCKTIYLSKNKNEFADYLANSLPSTIKIIKNNKEKRCNINKFKFIFYSSLKFLDTILATFYFYIFNLLWKKKVEKFIKDLNSKKFKIYFDRSDLIGDAIITSPLFFALKKIGFNFTVLTSRYNNWVLSPFFNTKRRYARSKIKRRSLFNVVYNSLYLLTFAIQRKIFYRKRNNCVLFLLKQVSDFRLINEYKDCYLISCVGKFVDFLYSDYVFCSKFKNERQSLLKNYLNCVRINNLRDNIDESLKEMVEYAKKVTSKDIKRVYNKLKNENYYIVFVGNKRYRRLPPLFWSNLINKSNFNGIFVIIDDKGVSAEVVSKLTKKKTVVIKHLDSLWDGLLLASKANFVIGADGGGFNFLQAPTNSFEIILYVNPERWKPYSKCKYKTIIKDKYTLKISKCKNLIKEVLHVNKKWRGVYEFYNCRNTEIILDLVDVSFKGIKF